MPLPKRTAFEKTIPDYRRRILISLFKALVIPPMLTWFTLKQVGVVQPLLVRLIAMVLSVPVSITIKSEWRQWNQRRAAIRLGASTVVQVKGKWPGNLDIAMRLVKAFEDGYALQGFSDLFEEYQCTTINTRLFWSDQVVTMDENVMKFVYATGFSHFTKGIQWHERLDKLLGTGLFNAEGDIWKKGRSTARPFFAKERISDFEIFESSCNATLGIISDRTERNQPFDIQDLLSRFALDTASEFLFGTKLGTLARPLPQPGQVKLGPRGSISIHGDDEFDVFTEAFERVAVTITRRGMQGESWPLRELFRDKTESDIRIIMQWLEPIVQRTLRRREEMKKSDLETTIDESVFLDFLASKTDDIEHIRYELVTYMIASRDTTASLLTFVLYFFALHPEVCKRTREEILSIIGPEQLPTYEHLRRMKYLRAVFDETLRLFPSAPLIGRASQDTPLVVPMAKNANNLYLPPRTAVRMISMLLHRRHDLWGESADEFKPERWFDEQTLKSVRETPYMYCPFSGGPRVCIGRDFALNEAGYFIVRLLQRYQGFTLAPEFQPAGSLPNPNWIGKKGRQSIEKIFPAISLTMYSKGGLWIFATPTD